MQDEREANLPKWAQSLLADLRRQIGRLAEETAREIAKLRRENELHCSQSAAA